MFPSTITALCELAGVNVGMESDLFLKSASTLGGRAFNKIAMARGEKPIQEIQGGTKCKIGKKNAVGQASISRLASGSNSVVVQQDGLQKDMLVMLLDGQQQIIELLKKIDSRLPGFQGDIINVVDDLPVNDNNVVDVNNANNDVLGLNGHADHHVDDNVLIDVENVDGNDSLADVSLDENEDIGGIGAVRVDDNETVGGKGDLVVLATDDIDNVWNEVLTVGNDAINLVKSDDTEDTTDYNAVVDGNVKCCNADIADDVNMDNEVVTGVLKALEANNPEQAEMIVVDKSDGGPADGA